MRGLRFIRVMKCVELTVVAEGGRYFRESNCAENGSDLPVAIMRAVEDFMEAYGNLPRLTMTIYVRPSPAASTE